MKKINIAIVVLLVIGVIGITLVEAYLKPERRRQEQQYMLEQADPLTHDFAGVLRFKSMYMGDNSNFINLNAALPLQDIERTFVLHPDTLTAEIFYRKKAALLDQDLLKRALIYNSTANFTLIDNLEVLTIHFEGTTYTITREALDRWYGVRLSGLQDESVWGKEVQRHLQDPAYVDSFLNENIE